MVPQKSRFPGPTPSNGPSNGFARIIIIQSKRHKKTGTFGKFMYMSFCILYYVLCTLQYVVGGKGW
jgi:hypothetical protein